MKKIVYLLLFSISAFLTVYAQSPCRYTGIDAEILLKKKPQDMSDDTARKIICGFVDTVYSPFGDKTLIKESAGAHKDYYQISVFPPVVKEVRSVEKLFLRPQGNNDLPEWDSVITPYLVTVHTDYGLIRWRNIAFFLGVFLSLVCVKLRKLQPVVQKKDAIILPSVTIGFAILGHSLSSAHFSELLLYQKFLMIAGYGLSGIIVGVVVWYLFLLGTLLFVFLHSLWKRKTKKSPTS